MNKELKCIPSAPSVTTLSEKLNKRHFGFVQAASQIIIKMFLSVHLKFMCFVVEETIFQREKHSMSSLYKSKETLCVCVCIITLVWCLAIVNQCWDSQSHWSPKVLTALAFWHTDAESDMAVKITTVVFGCTELYDTTLQTSRWCHEPSHEKKRKKKRKKIKTWTPETRAGQLIEFQF